MPQQYKPALISKANLTNKELQAKQDYEAKCLKYADQLSSKTGNDLIQYLIYRYRFWTNWNESHFDLLLEYVHLQDLLETTLDNMKENPALHKDAEYRKVVKDIEASIKIVQKALKLSPAIEGIVEEYEAQKHIQATKTESDPLLKALKRIK